MNEKYYRNHLKVVFILLMLQTSSGTGDAKRQWNFANISRSTQKSHISSLKLIRHLSLICALLCDDANSSSQRSNFSSFHSQLSLVLRAREREVSCDCRALKSARTFYRKIETPNSLTQCCELGEKPASVRTVCDFVCEGENDFSSAD